MKKFLSLIILFLALLYVFGETKQVVIIHTSDLHGFIYPVDYSTNKPANYGLARVSSFIKEQREKYGNENVVIIDTGDLIQGSPMAYYYARFDTEKEHPMIIAMNKLGFSASVFGNHEFNYGLDLIDKVMQEANFPFISANVTREEDGIPLGFPYTIVYSGDVRIGILGLTTKFVPNWEDPRNIKGIKFIDPLEAAKNYISGLRENCDVVIVAYHGGLEKDPSTGTPTEPLVGENQGYEIVSQVNEIDILLTGHQHRSIATKIGNVAITQPSNWGKMVGKITVTLEKKDDKWIVVNTQPELIDMSKYEPDKEILDLIKDYEDNVQKWLDTPVGTAQGDFYIADPFVGRLWDNSLMEFVNRVQMHYSGAKISSTALFTNDVKGWKSGFITIRNVNSVYIYPNTLKVIKVKGKDIKAALERSADYFTWENGVAKENKNWIEPKVQRYNYDIWEGISYKIVLNRPSGDRIIDLMFEGRPLDLESEYEIVLNNYRAGGGGGYSMFAGKPIVREVLIEVAELISNYIIDNKTIIATVDNNWGTYVEFEYVVAEGDSWQSIAKKLNVSVDDLIRWNDHCKNCELKPGEKLKYYVPYLEYIKLQQQAG